MLHFFSQDYSPLSYTGADAKLQAAAKKEGGLTLYTSIAEKDLPPLRETFEKKYGVKLTVLNALSMALVKLTVETALNAERNEHLGDER